LLNQRPAPRSWQPGSLSYGPCQAGSPTQIAGLAGSAVPSCAAPPWRLGRAASPELLGGGCAAGRSSWRLEADMRAQSKSGSTDSELSCCNLNLRVPNQVTRLGLVNASITGPPLPQCRAFLPDFHACMQLVTALAPGLDVADQQQMLPACASSGYALCS
jgi:hypothetical protein